MLNLKMSGYCTFEDYKDARPVLKYVLNTPLLFFDFHSDLCTMHFYSCSGSSYDASENTYHSNKYRVYMFYSGCYFDNNISFVENGRLC